MIKILLIIFSILITTKFTFDIKGRLQYNFCKKVINKFIEQENVTQEIEEKDAYIWNLYRTIFPFKLKAIYFIPFINLISVTLKGIKINVDKKEIDKIINSNEMEIIDIFNQCLGIDEEDEDIEDFVLDEGISYFIRFEKNGKNNNIWFSFVNHELVIESAVGEISKLSLDDQKLMVLTILLDLGKGKTYDYGFRDIVLELVDSYNFYADSESNEQEVIIKRERKILE